MKLVCLEYILTPLDLYIFIGVGIWKLYSSYFRCYTVHVVELLNYDTNYCTYIKFIKFKH